jgi:hypothetical protein
MGWIRGANLVIDKTFLPSMRACFFGERVKLQHADWLELPLSSALSGERGILGLWP